MNGNIPSFFKTKKMEFGDLNRMLSSSSSLDLREFERIILVRFWEFKRMSSK